MKLLAFIIIILAMPPLFGPDGRIIKPGLYEDGMLSLPPHDELLSGGGAPPSGPTQAALFTASESDSASVAADATLADSTALTLEFWLYFTSLPSSGALYDLAGRWSIDTTSAREYRAQIWNASGQYRFRWRSCQGLGSDDIEDMYWVITPSVGAWQHYAAGIDLSLSAGSSRYSLHVGASDQGACTFTTQLDPTAMAFTGTDFLIGRSSNSTNYLDGRLADMRLWTGARRTTAQIAANYQTQVSASASGLAMNLLFDGDMTDETANANDATNDGASFVAGYPY